jgi:hypothetical protein
MPSQKKEYKEVGQMKEGGTGMVGRRRGKRQQGAFQ